MKPDGIFRYVKKVFINLDFFLGGGVRKELFLLSFFSKENE